MTENALEDGVQDALNRMRRAARRGTGCYLTAEMISCLEISTLGQIWSEEDPRAARSSREEGK